MGFGKPVARPKPPKKDKRGMISAKDAARIAEEKRARAYAREVRAEARKAARAAQRARKGGK